MEPKMENRVIRTRCVATGAVVLIAIVNLKLWGLIELSWWWALSPLRLSPLVLVGALTVAVAAALVCAVCGDRGR